MASSDSLSSAAVASSSSRIGASFKNARAMAMRCRWPPENLTPRSPTMVASPCGNVSTKSQRAAIAARSTSSSVEVGRPYRIFSMIDRWNSEMSCGTTEIALRRLSWVTREMLWPSMEMWP